MHDDFTIAVRLEHCILVLQPLSQRDMVVDLSVDGEDSLSVIRDQRLGARVYQPTERQSRHPHPSPISDSPTPTIANRS